MPAEFPNSCAVALNSCKSYSRPELNNAVLQTLAAAEIAIPAGTHVLVKPNLLMAKPLACTNAEVTAEICKWLLDCGARVTVADSPGFGRAVHVARAIGLEAALKPLGLKIEELDKPVKIELQPDGQSEKIFLPVSQKALDCDLVFSLAKFKAHKQLRITLSVKNCYGCISGLRKAMIHARYGKDHDFFASCVASLWSILPPVFGFVDGVTAMHVSGPGNGKPFALGLLACAKSAPVLDTALMQVVNVSEPSSPLQMALRRMGMGECEMQFPLLGPHDFEATGFIVPENLMTTSFNPFQLGKSLFRRVWRNIFPDKHNSGQ